MSHAIIDAIYGDIKVKKQKVGTYNHGHKIMKHLKILVKVPFATSKVVLDNLSQETLYRSCLTSCRTTLDLGP